MQNIELKSVYVNDKDAKGNPLLTKNGHAYHRVVIESIHGNKASCNIWQQEEAKLAIAKTWKPGMTIAVELTQSGEYTNFDFEAPLFDQKQEEPTQQAPQPTQDNGLVERVKRLEDMVAYLQGRVDALSDSKSSTTFDGVEIEIE